MRQSPGLPVITVADANALYGEGQVRWMVTSGRWQRPARGVVVRHSGPLSPNEHLWCELLVQSSRAVVAGVTAASLDGLTRFDTPTVFLLVPHGSSIRRRPGVVVHSSTALGDADLHPARLQRRTRPARSIIDAGAWAATDLKAQALIASAVQQGLVTPTALSAAVGRLAKVHRRPLILETIRDVSGGALSEYEILFNRLCRRSNLPTPTRQWSRRDSAGRWR
ncbi:MAG: hypothetical protein ABI720_09605 [Actinomycetes bacterium]